MAEEADAHMGGKAEAGSVEAEQADRGTGEDQSGGREILEGVGRGERMMVARGATAGPGDQGEAALVDHFQSRVRRAWQIRAPPVASAVLQSVARLPPLLRTSATSGALLAGGDVCAQCIELSSVGKEAQIRDRRGGAKQASDTRGDEATLSRSSSSSSSASSSSSSDSSAMYRDGSGNAAAGPAPTFHAARSLRMMVYGACIYGPALHVWYPLVERAAPGRSLGAAVGKVLASQALLNPCLIAAVFAYNYAWTGQLHALKDKYQRDFLRTWRRGWHFWLPASFASFRLVPLHLRPAFSSACSLLWNCHLSMVTMHQVGRHNKRDGAAIIALLSSLFGEREARILVLGLDNAGKTTILYRLQVGEVVSTIPTIGFNVETVQYKNIKFQVWDLGGQTSIRPYWRCYYPNTQAVIYVVDSTDVDRIGTSKEEFHAILDEEELKEAVVLVYANKQDLPGAMSEVEVSDALGLHKIKSRPWAIYKTSAVKGDGLFEGLDWLSETLKSKAINGHQSSPRSHLVGRVGEFEGELNYYLPERFRTHPERVSLVTRPLGFPLSTARLANIFLHFFEHLPSDKSEGRGSEESEGAAKLECHGPPCPSFGSCTARFPNVQACWNPDLVDPPMSEPFPPINCPLKADSAGDGSRSQARFDETCSHEQDVGVHGAHALQMMRLEDVYVTNNGFALNRSHLFVRSGCPHFPGKLTYDEGHMVHELPTPVFNWAHQPAANFYHFLIEVFPLFLVAAPLMPSPLRDLPVLVREGQVHMYEQLGMPLIGIPLDQMRLLPTSGYDLFHAGVVYQPIFQNCHHPSQSLWRLMRRRHLLHPSGVPLFNPDWTLRNHRPLSAHEARSFPSDWVVVLAKRPKGKKRAIVNFEEVEEEVMRRFGRERVVLFDGSLPILQ
ncbi:unnamed protein product, partial [Closterium sp. Yama58-4]